MYKVDSIYRSRFKICDTVVTTDKGIKIPSIVGQVGQVDVVSQNGYRYKRGFWDKVLGDPSVQEKIKNRDYLGTVEHPTDDDAYMRTPYDKASHVVIKAYVKDGNPYAVLGLLNNDQGNAIKALIDVGHCPGVSTRGLGDFDNDDVSQFVSDKDYVLLGWDIVKSPNFADLKMERVSDSLRQNPMFRELVQLHGLKDSAATDYNRSNLLSDREKLKQELIRIISQL